MKTLSVKKISFPATESAAQIPSIFDAEQIPFQQINCVNWKDYPYMPEAKFRIAHTGDAVLIHYCITEKVYAPSHRQTTEEYGKIHVQSSSYNLQMKTNITTLNATVPVRY